MAKEIKTIANNMEKEQYDDFVNEYLEQLQSENDITLFDKKYGCYYYMFKGLVHEIKLEKKKVTDETFASWSIEEKNFVMNILDDREFF